MATKTRIKVTTPKAHFKGHVIVRARGGYVVKGEWFKTLSDATDSLQ